MNKTLKLIAASVLALGVAAPSISGMAQIHVTTTADVIDASDGETSLREAVLLANQSSGQGIELPPGVYQLEIAGAWESAAATGDLNLLANMIIRGQGAGATIIDGNNLDRVFSVSADEVWFEGLTIRGGNTGGGGGGIAGGAGQIRLTDCRVTGNRAGGAGGGISSAGELALHRVGVIGNSAGAGGGISSTGELALYRVEVVGNRAGAGGGIDLTGWTRPTLMMVDTQITGNVARVEPDSWFAHARGGGLSLSYAAVVYAEDCLISKNSAIAYSENGATSTVAWGGGINASPSSLVVLVGSTVVGNRAIANSVRGGGIAATSVTGGAPTYVALEECEVSGNSAIATPHNGPWGLARSSTGGGLDLSSGLGDARTFLVTNKTAIEGNVANHGDGGGLHLESGTGDALTYVICVNTRISTNSALYGGGISGHTHTGSARTLIALLHCTLAENAANGAGGIWMGSGIGSSLALAGLFNTLVAANTQTASADLSGQVFSWGHNLVGVAPANSSFVNGVNGDQVGTSGSPLDPQIVLLEDGIGLLPLHAPLPSSPAIDTGREEAFLPEDLRSFSRPLDGNFDGVAIVDIGAYEHSTVDYFESLIEVLSYIPRHGPQEPESDVPILQHTNTAIAAQLLRSRSYLASFPAMKPRGGGAPDFLVLEKALSELEEGLGKRPPAREPGDQRDR